jgi:endonuclease/exonuclease/phosphatase family metal-dependent hydrolase
MKKIYLVFLLVVIPVIVSCETQSDTIFVAFWNLQNLFDTTDDPAIDDEEFLPGSELEWTEDRLDKKMYNLARTIRMMNNGKGPDILGVCEVENEAVLTEMMNRYLSDLSYQVAYIESPDNRGIDNGLLFRKDKFKLLSTQADTVHLSDGWPTRLIFGVNLLTNDNTAVTVFVNHWPSRSGGQLESEPKRISAAQTLRTAVDRIFQSDSNANIIIIGDFNDEPLNKSVLETLTAHPLKCDSINAVIEFESGTELFNLSYVAFENEEGTFKYKDDWNMLDQIIVSGNLITGNDLRFICGTFNIFKPDFIVTKTGQYAGTPFPTYGGRRYLGGYSDHFPVSAKFLINRSGH